MGTPEWRKRKLKEFIEPTKEDSYYRCWTCLCNVCTKHRCPYLGYITYHWDICYRNQCNENCPVTHCDYFVHKCKHKIYRIKPKILVDAETREAGTKELIKRIAKKLEIDTKK